MTDEPVKDREPVLPTAQDVTSDEAEAAEQVSSDITALAAERDQFKDIAVRLQADFENYRKRITAQAGEEADRKSTRLNSSH